MSKAQKMMSLLADWGPARSVGNVIAIERSAVELLCELVLAADAWQRAPHGGDAKQQDALVDAMVAIRDAGLIPKTED